MGIFDVKEAFDTLTLTKDSISKGVLAKETHPLTGVTARVENEEQIRTRVTATRLLAIGLFAFAAKKKSGGESFLTVEGPDFFWTIKVDRKKKDKAIKFASKVNDFAKKVV